MPTSRHLAIVGHIEAKVGRSCQRPYQHIRVAVHCDDEQPDEMVTIITEHNAHYVPGQRINVERNRAKNIVSYRIVGDDE